MASMSGRGVKYCPAPPLVSCAFFSSSPSYVGVQRGPLLAPDQVRHQPLELGRVLDAVLRLAKDDAQHPGLLSQFLQCVAVLHLQRVAVF
jgi:hypothetical protein